MLPPHFPVVLYIYPPPAPAPAPAPVFAPTCWFILMYFIRLLFCCCAHRETLRSLSLVTPFFFRSLSSLLLFSFWLLVFVCCCALYFSCVYSCAVEPGGPPARPFSLYVSPSHFTSSPCSTYPPTHLPPPFAPHHCTHSSSFRRCILCTALSPVLHPLPRSVVLQVFIIVVLFATAVSAHWLLVWEGVHFSLFPLCALRVSSPCLTIRLSKYISRSSPIAPASFS